MVNGFSNDGIILVCGGKDKAVRLWPLNQGRDEWTSTEMETKSGGTVSCLAFSLDNIVIFSGGTGKLFVVLVNSYLRSNQIKPKLKTQ